MLYLQFVLTSRNELGVTKVCSTYGGRFVEQPGRRLGPTNKQEETCNNPRL